MIEKCQGCGRREHHQVPVGCLHSLQAQVEEVRFVSLQNLLNRLDQLEQDNAELARRLDEYTGGSQKQPSG